MPYIFSWNIQPQIKTTKQAAASHRSQPANSQDLDRPIGNSAEGILFLLSVHHVPAHRICTSRLKIQLKEALPVFLALRAAQGRQRGSGGEQNSANARSQAIPKFS